MAAVPPPPSGTQPQPDAAPAPPRRKPFDVQPLAPRDPNAPQSHPFTDALNQKLTQKIEPGKSIFDPAVMSKYYDDPAVTERDKQTIAYAIQPNLMSQAFDETIKHSIGGEPIQSKGLLGRAMSAAIDVAGKPIGKVFDALQYPADKTEQAIGVVLSLGYSSDLSLSERWKMGRLTYEAYGQTGWWKFNGDDKLNEWSQQVSSGDKTIDDLMKEHEHGVPDLVGKMILDPLWLLGGFPAVPNKLYKAGEGADAVYKTGAVATLFRGLGEGVRLEQFGSGATRTVGALERVPLVGKPLAMAGRLMFGGFVPSHDKILADSIAEWGKGVEESQVGPMLQNWRNAKGLFNLTPQAKADAIYNHLSIAIANAKADQPALVQLARAIRDGNVDAVPEIFGAAFHSQQGRILFEALREQGIEVTKFPSMLKGIHPDQAVWDAADEAAKATTHRNGDAFIAAMQQDIHEIAYPALQRWNGVRGDIVKTVSKAGEVGEKFVPYHSPVSKFTNGMKFWFSTTMLNRPGFVGLNYFNNGMTLAADWGFSRGVKHWLDPMGRRGWKEKGLEELLVHAGLVDKNAKDPIAAIKNIVGDRSVQREMLGLSGQDDKLLGISKKYWAPMVTLTSQFDMGSRIHAFYEMFGRAHNAVWKFEGGATHGVLPDIPNELALKLGPDVAGRLRGAIIAAGPDPEALRNIAKTMQQQGRPPLTAEMYIHRMGAKMGLEGDNLQAFNDMFEPAFRTRISAILQSAGNSTEKLASHFDTLKGALRQQEHIAREMDNLMPKARDYKGLAPAMADHEAMMVERDKEQLIQLRRFLSATGGDVDSALKGLAQVQDAARTRRYSMQYASQLLGISPQALERDVMFQMVPEGLRPGVKEMHAELVHGLDGVGPDSQDFYNVLGDLAHKWEKHTDQTVADLLDFVNSLGGKDGVPPPMLDFFESFARTETDVAAKRDHVFAQMIDNHPGADATESAGDWISQTWSSHYSELDNVYNDALEKEAQIFGFEHRMPPHVQGGEVPSVGEMLGVRNSTLTQFMDFVQREHVVDKDAMPFIGDAADHAGIGSYLEDLVAQAPDAKATITLAARRAADFSMLNYDRRYGIDHWMAMVYPYSFWPTRSMWHWAQRGIARPGAVAATAKLYSLSQEINTDAAIPQRFRQSIRIPIPFLDKSLQGGSMYFDPIKVLFPTAQWSIDDSAFGDTSGHPGTFLGVPRNAYSAVNQWAKVVGPGVNPFIDTALQYAGGDERALYLKYRFSSLPFMIPGPRQLQAAYSFTQSGEDPENILDDKTKEALATGQHLPDSTLKQILGLSDDDYDLYRTQRVLANQVGDYMTQGHSIEERKAFVNQALDAMFTRKGSLWNNARTTSQHETGLSIVTGWIFGVPVRQYPNGEATSRGLDALYKQVQERSRQEGGGDMTGAFQNMFPEVEVKKAAVEIFNGTDKQDSEIAGSLFAQELDKVHGKYDQQITDLNATLVSLSKGKALTTKEGRRAFDVTEQERNALSAKRGGEIDNLDKTYDSRNQDPSLSRTPRTRSLQELETAYYAIEVPDKPTALDFDKQKAAQKAFIAQLPAVRDYSPLGSAVEHYAQMKSFDRQITAAYDAGDRELATSLVEQRQALVKEKTGEMKTQISQKEFKQYLDRNKRMPTTQELERDQASQQMSEYFAVKDRGPSLGYSSKETASLQKTFWSTHPLLQKYYGNDEHISVHTFGDVQKYDRMEAIWEQFYATQGGSQARIDYLAMTLDELNGLRRHFGLPAVKVQDPYWQTDAPPPRYEGSNPSGY